MPGCSLNEIPDFARVLLVVAHPDDIDFSSAGTVARFRDAGAEVTYCLATRGDQGGFDAQQNRQEVGPLREREQRAAAAVLGVDDVRFLDFRDGHVEVDFDLRRAISRVIRDVRPELVMTHQPQRNWQAMPANHPDHMAVGEATLRAVYPDARNPFAFPELLQEEKLEPWTVHEVWIMSDEHSDHTVDITEVIDRKIAALQEHKSQVAGEDVAGLLRRWNGDVAFQAGLGEGRLAEQFRAVHIPM